MNKREVAEIRRRYKSEKSSIARVRGCYVNENKEIISRFDQSLGLMSESEADQILSVLKKTLSGAVGTQLQDIGFSTAQVPDDPAYARLAKLRDTALKDDAAVEDFYRTVIDALAIKENYMILLAADTYDVFSYRKDGGKSDESGEVFRYILCSICPVHMAKPTLSYYIKESCFRNVSMDSVISPPALGFMFPAFDNRSTNIYGALYYTRSTKENHQEFVDAVFRTGALPMPAAEQKDTFRHVLAEAVGDTCSLPVVRSVRAQLCQAIEEHKANKDDEPLLVDKYTIRSMLDFCGVPEENMETFERKFDEGFGTGAEVKPEHIVDVKKFEVKTPDVIIKVNPERTDLIETRIIDGVRYILIRADQGAEVNGIDVRIES